MPKKRNAENRGLPQRWQLRHGAFYYRVPIGQEKRWDGKSTFRLGSTMAEAYRTWASRIEQLDKSRTLDELIDRYSLEHLSTLAAKTSESYSPALVRIRTVFGEMDCTDFEAHHANTYFDRVKRKHGIATARGDIAVLLACFLKRFAGALSEPTPCLVYDSNRLHLRTMKLSNGRSMPCWPSLTTPELS